MTILGWIQIVLFCAIVVVLVLPLGWYMTRVFNGERTFLSPVLRPVETALYWAGGVDEKREQHWLTYTVAMLLFHVFGFFVLYGLLRFQALLPFNPAEMSAVAPDLSFNTAVSFITNTNWQNYGGESTLSYLVQMLGLTHQNFLSAATGIVLALALIRGFARASARTVGNFWVDITRCTLYILLPICIVYTLFLVWQGIPQTLGPYVDAATLEGAKQTIAVGPVASQVAIKMLGTNGGGFFNANASHPFENPTALSNFIQMISIFAIGAALTNVFGRMVGNQRQGWAILGVMGILFIAGVAVTYWAEAHGNDAFTALGLTGGNMEGKEVRFGIVASALFAVITTAASCGAVNAMHDSFTALGGMIPLINMQLGEIIIGGVGAGLYGMLLFVIIAIFVAGLMVGRTPEYVGKKIEAKEVKMAMLAILILPLMYLGWTAVAVVYPPALASIANPGPHGFTEVLYAFTSQTANNGSAFGGLTGNIFFYNVTGALSMLVGRFWMIIPAMAIAGSLAAKKSIAPSAGTLPTTGGLFIGLVVGVIMIIGGLTFFPALALGPIVEHLAMTAGTLFYRMTGMVNSLISDAMADALDITIRKEPVDIAAMVRSVVEANQPVAARKDQEITVAAPARQIVPCDADHIREAIDNLLSNAIKYSPMAGKIDIAVGEDAGVAIVSITDQGPGLSPEDLSRLFGRFQRLSAKPTGGESSTGLGLSIVKRIIDLHEGSIAASIPATGRGTTFTITLPSS